MHPEHEAIGQILRDPSLFAVYRQLGISKVSFASERATAVWAECERLLAEGITPDLATVAQGLSQDLRVWLVEVTSNASVTTNSEHWAREILATEFSRRIASGLTNVLHRLANRQPFESMEPVMTALDEVLKAKESGTPRSDWTLEPHELLDLFSAEMQQINDEHTSAIMSGIKRLDVSYGGLIAPDLTVIAARPGVGKTTLGINILGNVVASNVPAVYFTTEMRCTQIAAKVISRDTRIASRKFRVGGLTADEIERLVGSVHRFSEFPMRINDRVARHYERLEDEVRRLHRQGKASLVIIDYVQMLTSQRRFDNRQKELAFITGGLKAMAIDLNIPIVACAQVNREAERRGKFQDTNLSHLKDSGSLEQDADNVIFIEHKKDANEYELVFAKMRHGRSGVRSQLEAQLSYNLFSDQNFNIGPDDE
jgi:replicative DNA helicase